MVLRNLAIGLTIKALRHATSTISKMMQNPATAINDQSGLKGRSERNADSNRHKTITTVNIIVSSEASAMADNSRGASVTFKRAPRSGSFTYLLTIRLMPEKLAKWVDVYH